MISPLSLGSGSSLHGLAGTGAVVTYTIFGGVQGGVSGVLAQGQLATADGLVYAPPSGQLAEISSLFLVNTSGTAVTGVTLGINGTAAGNQLLPAITLPAYGSAVFNDGVLRVYDVSGNIGSSAAFPFDTTIAAITTPLALGTAGTALTAAHRDHTHQSPGGIAASVAASAAIVNVEAQVVGATIPANVMGAGTTFRITAAGQITTAGSPGNDVFKVRIGTTTLTGNIAATITAAANASITAQAFYLQFLVTVRTAGASGTVVGQGVVWSFNASTGAFTSLNILGITTSSVALDTTAAKICELTAVTGAADSSVTFQNAAIEVVKM